MSEAKKCKKIFSESTVTLHLPGYVFITNTFLLQRCCWLVSSPYISKSPPQVSFERIAGGGGERGKEENILSRIFCMTFVFWKWPSVAGKPMGYRGGGDGARLCEAASRYLQPLPTEDGRFWEQEGFQPRRGHGEAASVLSVHPVGEAAGVRAETMRPGRRTSLGAVNLLKFPAAHVEPGWRQEAITCWGLQQREVGSLPPDLASQTPPGCRMVSSGLGKQIKSLLLFDYFQSVLPSTAHMDKEPHPYLSHPTSSLPCLAEGGSYPPVKYCCRIFPWGFQHCLTPPFKIKAQDRL